MSAGLHASYRPGSAPTLVASAPGLLEALRATSDDPDAVRARAIDRLAAGHDASHFSLVPAAVVTAHDSAHVGRLFAASAAAGVPLTFRAGGTSLSGQSVTSGVLVDARRHFRTVEIEDGGLRVRVAPGATVRQVNARLAMYGRKIGPDPASESACTIGGVVANNSSGMACGITANSYRTLESLTFVLPSGTVVDTAAVDADERLRALEPALHEGISTLRDRVRGNPASVRTITAQYAMKNTMGYGLNSFLDADSPVDILAKLMVGSEGTLAFLTDIVLRTVPILPKVRTGLLVFEDLSAATGALPELVATGAATLELLDAASLRVGQTDPLADERLRGLAVGHHAALLIEYQAATTGELDETCGAANVLLDRLPLTMPAELTADAALRAGLWHIRKGLYATVAGARPSGSTALLEDIAVPVDALLPTCRSLIGLFDQHGYQDSVIFGHAKDGNIHFMLNEFLGGGGQGAGQGNRFAGFTEDMVDLVLGHGGSLKAEHGTGRMMAPYVRRQFGDELYNVMWQVKRLCDPAGLLNPGVVLSDDPDEHTRNLKTPVTVEAEVDRCVECGFCEPVCPSKDITLTPRQRIVLRREREKAVAAGDLALVAEIDRDYDYDGLQTCAVDGMCQTACPVLINTGDLVKKLRSRDVGKVKQAGWSAAAGHWNAGTRVASLALTTAKAAAPIAAGVTRLARKVLPHDELPLWSRDLSAGGKVRSQEVETDADAVYFTACVGTMFGPTDDGPGVAVSFEALCERAGVRLTRPSSLRSMCCGTPWKSKGLSTGYQRMADEVLPALWAASERGRLPVVCDASSCTEGLRFMLEAALERSPEYRGLGIVDAVDFTESVLLAKLTVERQMESIALHPTCSSTRAGGNPALATVAAATAKSVTVPEGWGCCAFAGDRGLLHPELTASATAAEAASVADGHFEAYVSSNRTCELGMSRATGKPYRHVLELLDWATAPEASRPA